MLITYSLENSDCEINPANIQVSFDRYGALRRENSQVVCSGMNL
jgi:hypothetical protein